MAQAINVPDLMTGFQTVATSVAQSAATVIEQLAKANAASVQRQEAETQVGAANVAIKKEQGTAQLKQQRNNAAAAAAVGVNPDASSYLLTTLSASIMDKEESIRTRDELIKNKLDVKFLDDPLLFLVNQISAPFDVAARNLEAVQTQSMNSQLHNASMRFNEAAVVNAAIAETVTTKTIAAQATIDLAKATIAAQTEAENLARLNISGAQIRDAQTMEQWKAILALQAAKDSQARLALDAAAGARAAESLQMQREQHIWQRQEHADKKETMDIFQAKLDRATTAAGISRMTIKEYQTLPPAMRTRIDTLAFDPDVQNRGILGGTPAKALETLNTLVVSPAPGINIVRKHLMDIKNATYADMANLQTVQHGKPEDKERIVDKAIQDSVQKEVKNIPSQGGLYSPPPLLAVLSIKMLQDLDITKQLQGLAVSNPLYPTVGTEVFKSGLALITAGKLTPAQAANQIAMLYEGINSDNVTQRQYEKLALPAPTNHMTNVYIGRGWIDSKVINMMSRAQLEVELTRASVNLADPLRDFFRAPEIKEPKAKQ